MTGRPLLDVVPVSVSAFGVVRRIKWQHQNELKLVHYYIILDYICFMVAYSTVTLTATQDQGRTGLGS